MASCYGLILAGGLSSRMGTDKAQLRRNEQTMLEYSHALLGSLGMEVLISGGEQGVPDLFPELGPLAGIYTIVTECKAKSLKADALLIVPVDMPLLTPQLLQKLVSVGDESGTATCYKDCYLPLYLPVNSEVENYLEQVFQESEGDQSLKNQFLENQFIEKKPRSIKKMLAALGANELPVEDTQALSNVNTPEEWDTAKELINPN